MGKEIRKAKGGIAEEFRKLNIGETVSFSLIDYKSTSIRAASSGTLSEERKSGKKWITHTDFDDLKIYVTRIK